MESGSAFKWLEIMGGVVLASAFLIIYVVSVGWAARDAESRGKSGCLVAALVAFVSWPLSLLMWIVFRPESTTDKN